MDKKTRTLTLEEKWYVIKMVTEENMSPKDVAAYFKCGKTQIYRVVKEKDKIREKCLSSSEAELGRRREKDPKYSNLNRIVFEWYSAAKAKNFPISGPILQRKAKETAELLKIKSFSASNGWLIGFRKRHGISFHGSSKEENDDGKKAVQSFLKKLKKIIHRYDAKDVASVDETALFFRALPYEKSKVEGEKCSKVHYSKDRLTVLLLAFADGKLEIPMVIGENENPPCFKNLRKDKFPVEWRANGKALMTSTLFEHFLNKLDRRMEIENREILLFLDFAACHPKITLSNITLVYIPLCTSVLLPLENGIIQSVKFNYRKLMLQHIIAHKDSCSRVSDMAAKIDVLDAITFLSHSIKCVKSETIKKSFHDCGYIFENQDDEEEVACGKDFREIQTLIEEVYGNEISSVKAESFVNMDKNVLTEIVELDLKSIVKSLENDNETDSEDEKDEEDCNEPADCNAPADCNELEVPSSSQVMSYIDAIKLYAKTNGDNELYEKAGDLALSFLRMRRPIKENQAAKME